MSFFNPGTTGTTTATEPKDVEVADPPADSISSLAFSSAGEYLAVGSWDNNVRVYYCTFSVMPYLYFYLIGSYLRSQERRPTWKRSQNCKRLRPRQEEEEDETVTKTEGYCVDIFCAFWQSDQFYNCMLQSCEHQVCMRARVR